MNELFAIIGGDARQIALAARLARTGCEVRAFGLPEKSLAESVLFCDDWRRALSGATTVILPLPASPDGVRINTPLFPELRSPSFSELLDSLDGDVKVFGGRFTPRMQEMAQGRGRELFDYSKSDRFQEKNALPTAEAALAILMEREGRTINGLPVAVTGYGRVARALARLLVAMGAQVRVGARRREALALAREDGCEAVLLCGDESVLALSEGRAAVINTVPHWIFNREVLSRIDKRALFLDLASSPGGFDAGAARGLEIPVIWALALPGKYAPVTAGEIVAEVVLECLTGEEDV